MKYLNSLILLIWLIVLVGCNTFETSVIGSSDESTVFDTLDSVYIIVLLESNMDTVDNTAAISHNGIVICNVKESVPNKVFVPEDKLQIEWSTRHISGSGLWPYVYWLQLDGSGWSDTTITETIMPVDNNRYNIRGTVLYERF
jgi:hypothetical protein